jgi:hypothetical protein
VTTLLKCVVGALVATAVSGCGGINLYGGRQQCWSEADHRLATLMRGRLDLDLQTGGGTLASLDGTVFDVEFPFMAVGTVGETVVLTDDGRTIALDGETVTVFGGLGSDRDILVCSLEEQND